MRTHRQWIPALATSLVLALLGRLHPWAGCVSILGLTLGKVPSEYQQIRCFLPL